MVFGAQTPRAASPLAKSLAALWLALAAHPARADEPLPPIKPIWSIPIAPSAPAPGAHIGFEGVAASFRPSGGYVMLGVDMNTREDRYDYRVMISRDTEAVGEWIPVDVSGRLSKVVVTEGGEIYLAGYSREAFFMWDSIEFGDTDVLVIKLDPDGRVLWRQSFNPGLGRGELQGVAVLPSGGIALSARSLRSRQTLLATVSADGEWLWQRDFGRTSAGSSVSVFPDGRILLATNGRAPEGADSLYPPAVAAIFGAGGDLISESFVMGRAASDGYGNLSITALAEETEAYFFVDMTNGAFPLRATSMEAGLVPGWRSAPLREEPAFTNGQCQPNLDATAKWLMAACSDLDLPTVSIIDRSSGEHRTFVVQRPECQRFNERSLLVAPAGDEAVFLLSVPYLPPGDGSATCGWLARVEID